MFDVCGYYIFDSFDLTGQAIKAFLVTQKDKKAMQIWRSNQVAIDDTHRQLWPGIEITKLLPKQCKTSDAAEQTVWFRERTATTATLMSFIVHCIGSKYRGIAERAKACSGFKDLLHTLAHGLRGLDLDHSLIGGEPQHGDHVLRDAWMDACSGLRSSTLASFAVVGHRIPKMLAKFGLSLNMDDSARFIWPSCCAFALTLSTGRH